MLFVSRQMIDGVCVLTDQIVFETELLDSSGSRGYDGEQDDKH